MSCSVKISSAKSWSGSQRRINALAEESAIGQSPSCPSLGHQLAAGPAPAPQSHGHHHQLRPVKSAIAAKRGEDVAKLLRYIDENVIGKSGTFLGPFGRRKVVYCDYTATGRSLQFLEDYIVKEVLPYLGDTRASTSICSLQSSLFRHEARDIVRHAVGADEQDAVLFTGQSASGALRTLIRHLDLASPTTVFVGPFEHQANLRPWSEYDVKLVRVEETREGFLDLNDLERKLVRERAERPFSRLIGYFNAANGITGVLADDVATTHILRQHGALSIWDYSSAAPYVKMEMNPNLPGVGESVHKTVHKDAIIFAGHKLIGGAQTPGVLVVKRSLLGDELSPEELRDSHRQLRDPELRDESGTGGIVEVVRCGLAVQLKESLTPQAIASRQDKITRQVLSHVRTIPELILLGCSSQNVKRLATFSFMVRHPRGTFLHHNFLCAVLNDVFGVQARARCAGRHAHELMGIDAELARRYEALLARSGAEESNAETLRPGFAQLSLAFFTSEAEVGFVLEALKMVATEGWKLLPQYVLNPETGEWRHHTNSVFKDRRWLGSIRYTDGRMSAAERRVSGPGVFPQTFSDCLQTGRNTFNRARKMAQKFPTQIDRVFFDAASESLRWFMLPQEAQDLLLGHSQNVKHHLPFDPITYRLALLDTPCGVRRLNSDVPRSSKAPTSPHSPRHRSLPALSYSAELRKSRGATKSCDIEDEQLCNGAGHSNNSNNSNNNNNNNNNDDEGEEEEESPKQKSPATCPGSPMPSIRFPQFAVGEAVTAVVSGNTAVARLMSDEPRQQQAAGHAGSPGPDSPLVARARCNSLGSSTCRSRSGSGPGAGSPVPIPLSPQTLASLGIAAANSAATRHRHCSCSSQTELNSAAGERSASCSSPLLSAGMRQSSEDDLSAYFKERTKELATEIKSEIREVISKVDDALSESGAADSGHFHHHHHHPRPLERQQQHHDSFSASDIAELIMEFSKGITSEVKSEIRCMVNSVSRYSPDERSSSGCASPSERRRTPAEQGSPAAAAGRPAVQHVSSECSSDETVICVAKPSAGSHNNTDDDEEEEEEEAEHSEPEKSLPKIYSAVNSVSSQDSGINLSFHDSDRSADGSAAELGRSSSAESSSSCCGRRPRLVGLCKPGRPNDDLSEDDEIFFSATQQPQPGQQPGPQKRLDDSDETDEEPIS